MRSDAIPPVWVVTGPAGDVGYIASTWEIAGSVGYSGRPIDILVGIAPDARISGAVLVQHNEPILTLGISSEDIARYVQGFAGYDLKTVKVEAFKDSAGLPPIIAGATVSTGVIRDAVLRTARTVAMSRGLVAADGVSVDRVSFSEKSWPELSADGSLSHASITLRAAAERFGAIANPLPESDEPFLDAWLALIDPPTIGRNLLGQQSYTRAIGSLGVGDAAILVASNGVQSHRGTDYRTTGLFERIEIIQGTRTLRPKAADFLRIDKLAARDVPSFREISVFRIGRDTGFRADEPFRLEIAAERSRANGEISSLRLAVPYRLPKTYIVAGAGAAAQEQPLWVSAWERKPLTIAFVVAMIAWVASAFFVQEFFVARPRLWIWGRMGFLAVSLVVLGWIAKGQLSVVQVVAFMHALLNGFRWETFLIEPVIFILWSFVALGLLFWGRGVYCGWLCPFGAMQELLNEAAKRFGVKQIEVPFAIQERLWAIKYTLFVAILGLSFYSMEQALVLAEVEPFKTAVSMRFGRAWPFVAFAVALLVAGLFIERFYCRYLCPLGAALAIPAKLRLFDWLHRRPQCGRECRFCETQCTVGAIDTLGRINPNECVLCLRCQVIMNDDAQCIALKRRATRRGGSEGGVSQQASSTV
ncbi:MAG: 4Fe-4S binding protein [Hyphomicrobiaceae bacterium]|nr:4Fe-4S binding protein [Hyphomicrobiaceae bacterium]